MRLIEAEALEELIDVKGANLGITSANRCNFKDMIKMTPTVDAEPVKPEWISVKEQLPSNGTYLTVNAIPNGEDWCVHINIASYSSDLYSVDDFDFCEYRNKKHGGWYDYDSKYGYYERNHVTHWMPLPEFPTMDEEEHE